MRLSIAEIVKKTIEAKGVDEKVLVLQQNDSQPLRKVLRYTYDPEVKFNLPTTVPPWNKNGLVDLHGRWIPETKRFKIFVKGGFYDGKLNTIQVERRFIEMLESIDDKDAEIFANMITKKPIAGISKEVILKAFPNIYEEIFE